MRSIRRVACLLLVALAAPLVAAPAEDDIVLPKPVVVPTPMPPPAPAPVPSALPPLTADTYYVATSKVELVVRQHPAGLLKVTHEAGPVSLRGKFIDSGGKVVTRKFSAPHVYILEAAEGAKGRVEVDFIPLGLKGEADIKSATVDVDAGQGPQPPPKPDPAPDPKPKPDPAPIPAAGLHVLVVYESADLGKYPPGQQAILYGKSVRDYLNANCAVGPDGKTRQFRMWDKDVSGADDSPLWDAAMRRPRTSLPWVVVSNGATGFEGPLPATAADFLALVKKYGGK